MAVTLRNALRAITDNLPVPVRRKRWRELREDTQGVRQNLDVAHEELRWELMVNTAILDLAIPLNDQTVSAAGISRMVLQRAMDLTGSALGNITTMDPVTGKPVNMSSGLVHCEGIESDDLFIEMEQGDNGLYPGLWGAVLNSGRSLFINSPEGYAAGSAAVPPYIRRFLSVPVLVEGQAPGQFAVANSSHPYGTREVKALHRLAQLFAIALERKEWQRKTDASLLEKEVLLREVHHRVKNNLQVISSLLNLQAGSLQDKQVIGMLRDSQNRVLSMALVHEQLHRSKDLSRINFGEYARNLVASLFSSYGVRSTKIGLQISIDNVRLPIDMAIPCGLIIHELVSNSLRHAFPAGRNGCVRVSLRQDGSGRRVLTVEDDGIGWSGAADIGETKSLGLRLVGILADQMDATVAYEPGVGTRFNIAIPKSF